MFLLATFSKKCAMLLCTVIFVPSPALGGVPSAPGDVAGAIGAASAENGSSALELPLTWFAAAVKQLGPPDSHGALMYNDFAWLARRETAGQLANVWQETAVPQCSENGAQLFPTTEPIDFCRVADSAWPTSCSLFVRTIALPFGDEVLGAKVKAWGDEFPRVLPTMMCAN